MSWEDKARYTLHQILISDDFCQEGLVLGSSPVFDFLYAPPPTRHPFESRLEIGMTFLFALGFFIICDFFLFYCIIK